MHWTSAYQVQQWEQKDPDDIHEVPIQAEVLNHRVMMRRICPVIRPVDEENQDAGADDHVERVHPGHCEI